MKTLAAGSRAGSGCLGRHGGRVEDNGLDGVPATGWGLRTAAARIKGIKTMASAARRRTAARPGGPRRPEGDMECDCRAGRWRRRPAQRNLVRAPPATAAAARGGTGRRSSGACTGLLATRSQSSAATYREGGADKRLCFADMAFLALTGCCAKRGTRVRQGARGGQGLAQGLARGLAQEGVRGARLAAPRLSRAPC